MKKIWITALFLTLGICGFAQTARTQNTATTPLSGSTAPKGGTYKVAPTKQNAVKGNVSSTTAVMAVQNSTAVNPVKASAVKQSPATVRTEGK